MVLGQLQGPSLETGRVGHFNGEVYRVCLLTLTEITAGAPLLTLLEKWLAELASGPPYIVI